MTDPNLSSFLWSVADLLRGDYKQSEYGKVILTEREIRTAYLDNARFFRSYRRGQLSEKESAESAQILETLFEMRTTTPEELLAAMRESEENRALLLPLLWRLVANGGVGMDLSQPLSMQSALWSHEPHEDLPLCVEKRAAWC